METTRWIRENSAVCEITGYGIEKITKDRLYGISHKLYAERDALEQHLSMRTNGLFNIEDGIVLYDLTNTYFEGEKRASQLAKYGRSKEKRSDAKLVVLALVVNPEGFIKYSSILEGNMADPATLEGMIGKLRIKTSCSAKKALVVIDAGSGVYFLRTSLDGDCEQTLWQSYNTIRNIEATFRSLKSDLDLRPIYHKNDDSTRAHLHLGLLAYWVVNTVRHQLKESGINSQWREVVRTMNTQKAVTTLAQNVREERSYRYAAALNQTKR